MQTAISLDHVTKTYVLHHEKPTLVEQFIHRKVERFTALHDVSLKINKGEKVGIIGPNGSGKTTILKIIAGITKPTLGKVYKCGRVVSLIDLEAGFHPDLNGYQNILLNGSLLGMSQNEIKNQLYNIIHFADIRQFIDAPLYTYSDGMKLRLGFSIAIHANPDVLILDECIGVGDIEFSKKSVKRLKSFFKKNHTIIVSTHWLEFIKDTCNRVVMLGNGKIIGDDTTKLINRYRKLYR